MKFLELKIRCGVENHLEPVVRLPTKVCRNRMLPKASQEWSCEAAVRAAKSVAHLQSVFKR